MKKFHNKKILIFGVSGQDGSLLAKEFLKKNYEVFGVFTSKRENLKNLKKLKILEKIKFFNIKNFKTSEIILKTKCKYIFFFSGLASVTKSNIKKYLSITSNNNILIEILETIRKKKLNNIKVLNASSSEIFGKNKEKNYEESDINPVSYYGLAKSISTEISKAYRTQFKIKIFNAILFNHESPLRPNEYALQKIIKNVQKIYQKKIKKIKLGDIEVSRDWGWAPEYVKILIKIIFLKSPDDFIVCTGNNYRLKKIIKNIFLYYKLDYKKFISKTKKFIRPYEVKKISGDNTKLKKAIKYIPKIDAKDLIFKMINKEY